MCGNLAYGLERIGKLTFIHQGRGITVESIDRWEKKVEHASERAQNVYEKQLRRLEKQIAATDEAEAREIKRVEDRVDRDVRFAEHHLEYLARVVEREAEKVTRAYDRLAEKAAEGASEAALDRAAKHAARVEDDADRHVERVEARVLKAIKRDAKAAARHVYLGLEKLGLDEDHLDKKAYADTERVQKALDNVVKTIEG